MTIVVAIYNPAANYPPTLNAVRAMSMAGYRVILLSTGDQDHSLTTLGTTRIEVVLRKPGQTGKLKGFQHWFRYTRRLSTLVRQEKADCVLLYDDVPFLSWSMVRNRIKHPVITWYHNHDVLEIHQRNGYSLGPLAYRQLLRRFEQIDLFTLPATERLPYFPTERLKHPAVIIPNYPSRAFYQPFRISRSASPAVWRLIYQGRISAHHGLEALVEFVSGDERFTLSIIGPVQASYKSYLESVIAQFKAENRVTIYPPVSYEALAAFTATHHIGIGINIPHHIIYQTGGSASNKLYEYAALGLPTLYYDNPHYKAYLGKYSWAVPVDIQQDSLRQNLLRIIANYDLLSQQAIGDIDHTLNFEQAFLPVLDQLKP